MSESDEITGTIIGVHNYGSLVVVYLDAGEGRVVPVPFDHRAFQWLLEGEGCGPCDLIRRRVGYDGDAIRFLE
jgi:hypothetical protein